jgi:hypothetical protein
MRSSTLCDGAARTKLNVTTASEYVLVSSDDISLSTAESLIEERAGAEFSDIDTTLKGSEPEVLQRIDVVSEYFC